MVKKQLIIAKRKEEDRKTRAINDQAAYVKQKRKFFGLVFSNGNIDIRVLKDVSQFIEESEKLRHCLFTNDYHKKKDSLILKAQYKGESVETVEVCLKSFKVLQSRGKHNSPSKYNEEIISIIKDNIGKIKAISKPKGKMKSLKQLDYAEAI